MNKLLKFGYYNISLGLMTGLVYKSGSTIVAVIVTNLINLDLTKIVNGDFKGLRSKLGSNSNQKR